MYLLGYEITDEDMDCFNRLDPPWFLMRGNSTSKVNLKASSSILGINMANKGLDSSIQGLVLTSMSHTWWFSSMMKSKPNTSKQNFRSSKLIFRFTLWKVNHTNSFMRSTISNMCTGLHSTSRPQFFSIVSTPSTTSKRVDYRSQTTRNWRSTSI